jgi:hypothetical protein
MISKAWRPALAGLALLVASAIPASAVEELGSLAGHKPDIDGWSDAQIRAAYPEFYPVSANGRVQLAAAPDIFNHGAVLTVGDVYMKVTNYGCIGNPFTNVSSDPSGQWPGASSVEYLNAFVFMVGGVNLASTDPAGVRRVSYFREWRPPTLDPEDKMYPTYDGQLNGARFTNDDGDVDPFYGEPRIDEDFLDGRDNDGDGKIDEDFGAIGQQEFTCVIRDDTKEALNATFNEKHIPLGLECQQSAWAYSIPGFTEFNVVQFHVTNVSGHMLDSLMVGWLVDMDCGPVSKANYFSDDLDLPFYPQGEFPIAVPTSDTRAQIGHDPNLGPPNTPLCTQLIYRVNGFSIADDDGDDGHTPGLPTFMLINYTMDPLGISGPKRLQFLSFRSYTGGTPYSAGGGPSIDQERFEFMSGGENVDPTSGFITAEASDTKGDYVQVASVGPWRSVANGQSVDVTVAFGVRAGAYAKVLNYKTDYQVYLANGSKPSELEDLRRKYPALDNALTAQIAYEGVWEPHDGAKNLFTDYHGRETPIRLERGTPDQTILENCEGRERSVTVNSREFSWFDFDCDYCTGVYDFTNGKGLFHKTWNAEAPPPNPNTNLGAKYNYTDNPNRQVAPEGDKRITVAWDNLSEVTADPKSGWYDCRGYKIWKVANWTRPVGSPGPNESDWSLIGEFRLFDYVDKNSQPIPNNRFVDASGDTVCPKLYVPNYKDPTTGIVGPATVPICLTRGDLWDRQSGQVIRPDPTIQCVGYPNCEVDHGCLLGVAPNCLPVFRTKYPVGHYQYVDNEVKDGFLYFYSVTAFDSTGDPTVGTLAELNGRRTAVETEGVSPQVATRKGKGVWVVPNPYRGFSQLSQRPSSWDLTPNASDPTGTHIDFMGMPAGQWTLKIFTVAGDLVEVMKSTDPVNDALRANVTDDNGITRPGFNRQQDTANDGEARWNLISRNGQDVVSGIYLFTVESSQGTQRGRFVIIR